MDSLIIICVCFIVRDFSLNLYWIFNNLLMVIFRRMIVDVVFKL